MWHLSFNIITGLNAVNLTMTLSLSQTHFGHGWTIFVDMSQSMFLPLYAFHSRRNMSSLFLFLPISWWEATWKTLGVEARGGWTVTWVNGNTTNEGAAANRKHEETSPRRPRVSKYCGKFDTSQTPFSSRKIALFFLCPIRGNWSGRGKNWLASSCS